MALDLPTCLSAELTAQQILDHVTLFLIKQGRVSVVDRGTDAERPALRGPRGTMCAMGCLIPDSFYHPSMEGVVGQTIREGENYFGKSTPQYEYFQMLRNHKALLQSLQDVHDDNVNFSGERFVHRVLDDSREVAKKYRLDFSRSAFKEALNVTA
jgi:hypothetical protein